MTWRGRTGVDWKYEATIAKHRHDRRECWTGGKKASCYVRGERSKEGGNRTEANSATGVTRRTHQLNCWPPSRSYLIFIEKSGNMPSHSLVWVDMPSGVNMPSNVPAYSLAWVDMPSGVNMPSNMLVFCIAWVNMPSTPQKNSLRKIFA